MQRALDDVKPSYPALTGARCEAGYIVGLATDDVGQDPGALRDGFGALVEAFVSRLGRVVGEEMALRLVEQAQSPGNQAPNLEA
jgi:hypothetical protein